METFRWTLALQSARSFSLREFGFAYRLGENTVIRSGYGISYDPIPYSRPLRGFYPLTINYQYSGSQ